MSLIFQLIILASTAFAMSLSDFNLAVQKAAKNKLPPSTITEAEIEEDLEVLKYALNNAYVGSKVKSMKPYVQEALGNLEKVRGESNITQVIFCDHIRRSLALIPDAHLRINGRYCAPAPHINRAGKLTDKAPWHLYQISADGKKISVVFLEQLLQTELGPGGKLFAEVQKFIETSDAFILDLRKCRGGKGAVAWKIAEIFYGKQSLPLPYANIYQLHSPAVEILKYEDPSAIELTNIKKKSKLEVNHVRNSQLKAELLGFKGPIFLLTSRMTVSACEALVDFMRLHPSTKTAGSATGGMIHFGMVENLRLPNSQITVPLGSYFKSYRDGKHRERVGLPPDLNVPKNTDSLKYVLNKLLND